MYRKILTSADGSKYIIQAEAINGRWYKKLKLVIFCRE
jgi:hypothetical protein